MPVKRRKRDINERSMLIICYDSLIICQRCLKESFRVNYIEVSIRTQNKVI